MSSQTKFSTNQLNNAPAIKSNFGGIVIPVFQSALKFNNLGSPLPGSVLSIYSSNGLIATTSGTTATEYFDIPEITSQKVTRTDWLLTWDPSDTTASITLSIGSIGSGYTIVVANSSGNLSVTLHDGTTFSGSNTNITSLSVSFTTGNGSVTSSVSVMGAPSLTGSTNPYLVPVFATSIVTKNQLFYAGFSNNSVTSRIMGFLHNPNSLDGDPLGQLLTQTVSMNQAGVPGEHDNIMIIPARANTSLPLKVVHGFHGRTGTYAQLFTVTLGDAGATIRGLLNAGYAYIATSGGVGNTNGECDYWGNQWGIEKAHQVFNALQYNVKNIGKEYLFGESMGGVSMLNYARSHPDNIGAMWASCPVTDLEESGSALAIQVSSLKSSVDLAYNQWFYSLVASNTADPQTDNGTNWRLCSIPGGQPPIGMRLFSYTKVATGATSSTIALSSAASIFPGDIVYFKAAGIQQVVKRMSTGSPNSVTMPGSVTATLNEFVSVQKPSQPIALGWDFNWEGRPSLEWVASTQSQYAFAKRKTAHPELDVRPFNPTQFMDFYAELNVPIHIMVGGSSFTGNDGILNNTPMQTFANGVNAITANLVTLIQGSGSHVAATTFSASDTLSLFNAN